MNHRFYLRAVTRIFKFALVSVALTGCSVVENVQCRMAAGDSLAVPFCDDIASVSPEEFKQLHEQFITFAETLAYNPKKIDAAAEMQTGSPARRVIGKIVAFAGTQYLTEAKIAARPRIVAKVFTSERYNRGLQGNWSYMVVDGRGEKGWRVLLISESAQEPVSVIYNAAYKPKPDAPSGKPGIEVTDTDHAIGAKGLNVMVKFYRDSSEWKRRMTDPVKSCQALGFGACLVNRKGAKPWGGTKDERREDTDFSGMPTDEWVWVTESGCICLGTQCHNS